MIHELVQERQFLHFFRSRQPGKLPVIPELVREWRFWGIFEARNQVKSLKTVHSHRQLPLVTHTTPGKRRNFVVVCRGSCRGSTVMVHVVVQCHGSNVVVHVVVQCHGSNVVVHVMVQCHGLNQLK